MNQVLNSAQFLKIHPLDSNKSVLINIHEIDAIEELVEHQIVRIHVKGHTYEIKSSLDDVMQVLTRTAVISRV